MMSKVIPVAITLLLLAPAAQAHAELCAKPGEKKGLNGRALQTELMVAALSCKQQTSYNSVVQKFRSNMKSDSDAMRGYFKRRYGGISESKMDEFVTRIANDTSTRSQQRDHVKYCEDMDKLFAKVLRSSNIQMDALAAEAQFSNMTGIPVCK